MQHRQTHTQKEEERILSYIKNVFYRIYIKNVFCRTLDVHLTRVYSISCSVSVYTHCIPSTCVFAVLYQSIHSIPSTNLYCISLYTVFHQQCVLKSSLINKVSWKEAYTTYSIYNVFYLKCVLSKMCSMGRQMRLCRIYTLMRHVYSDVYTYIHVYVYICIYVYVRECGYVYVYVYEYLHKCIRIHICHV